MPRFVVCHKLPDRSFFYKGKQLPFCARCTGVCIGHVIALSLFWFVKPMWWLLVLFGAIMLIDWLIQYIKIRESTNIRRLITGIFGGYALLSAGLYAVMFAYSLLRSLV